MSLLSSILLASLGFAAVSVGAFSVWVFGGGWFHHHGGEAAMYASCCLVFAVLSGLLLHPLLAGSATLWKFYRLFIPAFMAYAVAWCAGWFLLGAGQGEWVASLAGSFAFAAVMAASCGNRRALLPAALVMFLAHSAGYFCGEKVCYASLHSARGELVWGLLYGLGFGAGIGHTFWLMQRK
jgi:hypothetical protein